MEITPQTLLKDDLQKRSFLCQNIQGVLPNVSYSILWERSANITRDDYRRLLAIMYRKTEAEFISAIKNKFQI